MKKLSIGFAALSAVAATAVLAQNATPPRADPTAPRMDTAAPGAAMTPGKSSTSGASVQFSTVDQNKDGRISRAEAVSHGAELGGAFATLDADTDTYLSQAEFGKWADHKKGADHSKSPAGAGGTMPQPATGSSTRTPATGQ